MHPRIQHPRIHVSSCLCALKGYKDVCAQHMCMYMYMYMYMTFSHSTCCLEARPSGRCKVPDSVQVPSTVKQLPSTRVDVPSTSPFTSVDEPSTFPFTRIDAPSTVKSSRYTRVDGPSVLEESSSRSQA